MTPRHPMHNAVNGVLAHTVPYGQVPQGDRGVMGRAPLLVQLSNLPDLCLGQFRTYVPTSPRPRLWQMHLCPASFRNRILDVVRLCPCPEVIGAYTQRSVTAVQDQLPRQQVGVHKQQVRDTVGRDLCTIPPKLPVPLRCGTGPQPASDSGTRWYECQKAWSRILRWFEYPWIDTCWHSCTLLQGVETCQ